ncbi:hypothetical protein SFUMM280S_04594 [Streptomyces fumanus]
MREGAVGGRAGHRQVPGDGARGVRAQLLDVRGDRTGVAARDGAGRGPGGVYAVVDKSLDGFGGAALAGPRTLVDEAKTWRHRYGGMVFQQFPTALAALAGLDRELPRLPEYVAHRAVVAAALREGLTAAGLPWARVHPEVPHTHEFQVWLPYDADAVAEAAVRQGEESDTLLFSLRVGRPGARARHDGGQRDGGGPGVDGGRRPRGGRGLRGALEGDGRRVTRRSGVSPWSAASARGARPDRRHPAQGAPQGDAPGRAAGVRGPGARR